MSQFIRIKQTRLDLLDALPKNLVMAELGVFCGDFSEQILERCSPRILFLVDTFEGIIQSGDQNGENMRSVDMQKMRWELEIRFSRKPMQIAKSDSIAWLRDQDDDSLDAVYIDTTHRYFQTVGELELSMHAVRAGGFICGHDFSNNYVEVIDAVTAFIDRYDLKAYIYEGDKLASFRIDKPYDL